MNGISRTHEQRAFVIGGHHIILEKERDTRQTMVYGIGGEAEPDCVVQTQVEITGQCDDCHCKYEMIAEDNKAEIQRIERYIFGAFVAHPCANIDRKV